jgi:NADH-quinone oxidoreductase subunit J
VLVVFGVMLTAQGPFITMKTSSAEWAVSGIVGVVLMAVLGYGIATLRTEVLSRPIPNQALDMRLLEKAVQAGNLSHDSATAPYSAVIGQGFLGVPVGPPHVERPGGEPTIVRAAYLLPFEIVSVHLLVVLIGAAYLARAKRRKGASA